MPALFSGSANLHSRHFSYECKSAVQERPYTSRPSRTQQMRNPKLVPQLTSDVPNDLLRTKGVADEQLAQKEKERGRARSRSSSPVAAPAQSRKRSRSVSSSSSFDSVSTISTNRSHSPKRSRRLHDDDYLMSQQETPLFGSVERKRRRRSSSSSEVSRSSSSASDRAPRSRSKDRHTRRRRSSLSPLHRGRRERSESRRNRSRNRSNSMDKSQIAKQRRSMTPTSLEEISSPFPPSARRGGDEEGRSKKRERSDSYSADRHEERGRRPPAPKERSLSPFSKRLALTSAMNSNPR